MLNFPRILNTLWEGLEPRAKEVLIGRFGLEKKAPQTLAELGSHYGVTRERIRQIEAGATRALRETVTRNIQCKAIAERSRKYLKEHGGVTREDDFLDFASDFLEGADQNHLALFLEVSGAFLKHSEDRYHWPFYYLDRERFRVASSFVSQWVQFLRARKEQVLAGRYSEYFEKFSKEKEVEPRHASSYVRISKKIGRNPYGDVGLTEWPEISPRTIRDQIYLVLKKSVEPLHFRLISATINDVGFGKRRASPPTVHNELIKDERFVLVGRGIYALRERGYEPGTAREVIERILKRQGSLLPKEIILAIGKERFLKPNTILVNLQNKTYFERRADGTYRVRQS